MTRPFGRRNESCEPEEHTCTYASWDPEGGNCSGWMTVKRRRIKPTLYRVTTTPVLRWRVRKILAFYPTGDFGESPQRYIWMTLFVVCMRHFNRGALWLNDKTNQYDEGEWCRPFWSVARHATFPLSGGWLRSRFVGVTTLSSLPMKGRYTYDADDVWLFSREKAPR